MAVKEFLTKNGLETDHIKFTAPAKVDTIAVSLTDADVLTFTGTSNTLLEIDDDLQQIRTTLPITGAITSLTSNITINLAGDLTGSVSFKDAGQSVTLTAAIANTSHIHAISEITGLQTALDAKVPTTRTVNGKALSANIALVTGDIAESTDKLYITAAERSAWNAKQTALGFTPENLANKGVANGYAGLDATGKLPTSVLPALAITETYTANSQTAMLALTCQKGDVCVRTDVPENYILAGDSPTVLANWTKLSGNVGTVTSVNGQDGAVTLTTANIADSSNKKYVTDAHLTLLGNTSGTNTGDETLARIGALLNGATAKTTPVDADTLTILDSAASNTPKKLSWVNTKATLKTYFDTLYNNYTYTLPVATTSVLGGIKAGSNVTIDANGVLTVDNNEHSHTTANVTGLDTALSGKAASSHTHGNITNAGAIGSTAGVPIITGASGVLQAGSFGTASGTFCQGNDSRLSNARTPTAHTHDFSDTTDAIVSNGSATLTTSATTQVALTSVAIATYDGLKVLIKSVQGTLRHITELTIVHNGATVYLTEYGTIATGADLFSVDADIATGNLRILITPTSATSTVHKIIYTAFKV